MDLKATDLEHLELIFVLRLLFCALHRVVFQLQSEYDSHHPIHLLAHQPQISHPLASSAAYDFFLREPLAQHLSLQFVFLMFLLLAK